MLPSVLPLQVVGVGVRDTLIGGPAGMVAEAEAVQPLLAVTVTL